MAATEFASTTTAGLKLWNTKQTAIIFERFKRLINTNLARNVETGASKILTYLLKPPLLLLLITKWHIYSQLLRKVTTDTQ